MAATLVSLVLASLIRFFDWSLPRGNDPEKLDMREIWCNFEERPTSLLLIPKARD